MGFIYKLTSPSGKAYIGQTVGPVKDRFRQHCWESGACTAIHRAIKRYGVANIQVETLLEVSDGLLDHYERALIDAYGTFERWGYNQTRGGDVNPMHDESVRNKCVATHQLPEVKKKHKAAMKTAMADPDRRERISATLSKTLSQPEQKRQRSVQISQAWTNNGEKRRASISKALAKPEVKEKQSKAVKAALKKKETKSKHTAALQRIAKDPAVQEKKRKAMKEYWERKRADLPPPREQ